MLQKAIKLNKKQIGREKIMKTTFLLGLVMTLCFALVGCGLNKDAEVATLMSDVEGTTKEMAAKIDANPTSAGVDEAQKVLESKKDSLKKRFTELKGATGYVSKDAEKKMMEAIERNNKVVMDMATKHTSAMMKDPAMATKLQKLLQEYATIFQ